MDAAFAYDRWLADHALGLPPWSWSRRIWRSPRLGTGGGAAPGGALPLAGLSHDPAPMILIAVMGTGFCQSMKASAMPVEMVCAAEKAGFAQRDRTRLALALAPAVTALVMGFALRIWPQQLARPVPIAPPDRCHFRSG